MQPSLADQITDALQVLERIQQYLHSEESMLSVPASRALSASIDLQWAITRLSSARGHLTQPSDGPGYDC
ncbi:MAG: hypothetical protein U0840_25715 [Gemmataceae bacterium]